MDSLEHGDHRHRASAKCYAWASFLVWTVIIFLLVFGIGFFAFVKSNLPEIKVHRLDVYKFNVTKPTNKDKNKNKNDAQVTIDVRIMVNVTNSNKRMTLVYGELNAEMKIEGFSLPKVRLDGFRQKAMRTNDLKIRPQEMRFKMNDDDDDVKQLNLTADHHEMVLSLKMNGKIQFWFKGQVVISNLHFKVSCDGVEQSQIDQALAHVCNVKLGFLR
ncbi:hypothetical protein E3N88_17742 [Mikania micrantha]|uniref:Late embryogenesis abundant protein LEA-2 subgroup domain-containing protein n=1 Tax=Mikania micrantha TaxID=192012 RepID=A0A5N6NSQ3_9ASTR|nr:hypothetical protein E3N88_17742 [Mikania micrantha]